LFFEFFFDLIYNPEKTATAILLESKGVKVKSGLEMLYLQAEASWEIWSDAIASC
jgi:shikimate dehydrogenase